VVPGACMCVVLGACMHALAAALKSCGLAAPQALVVTHTVATIDHEANGTSKSRPLGRSTYYSQISAATRQVRSTGPSELCPALSHLASATAACSHALHSSWHRHTACTSLYGTTIDR
jgi:hypothetical protein